MTINIQFRDEIVRVAVALNGGIESAIAYLPKRKWVGLTDEEISAVDWKNDETLHDFAKAIEAKLKEKNTCVPL